MPPRRVNVKTSAQEDGTSSSSLVLPHKVNIPDEGVVPLMEVMIGVFQLIATANPAPAPANPAPWLKGLERILKQMSYSGKEKLGCAVSLLDGEAHRWWNTVRRGTVTDKLTWSYFLEGDIYVVDYEVEFVQLSQYAPELLLFERDRCKRFRFGLNREVRVYLVAQNVKMFDELVERAKVVKDTLVELPHFVVTDSGKRTFDGAPRRRLREGSGFVNLKFGITSAPTRGLGRGKGNERPVGQQIVAHTIATPIESRVPTQVYAIREPEDQDLTDVIAGTFTLPSSLLFFLIDSGSTHSCILSELACKLAILVETIGLGMIIIGSFGDSVVVNKVYRKCLLMIQRHVFFVDLMELLFYGFDVILGMDWLTEHKAKAKKLMGKGCEA
ncbi:uncharacterized protein LOC128034084 [Gossypium raimondii]|uniref:uncharacterized protein LOC128034084 n=1 Tax=Gossypium raimondii TaxID=29730 RepID=UPI00227C317E|nr:uncharacterized protein LOC128034084 [Gossypium raimondii]